MAKKKAIWVIFGILVISGWVLGSAIQAKAETLNYKFTTWQIKSETNPAFDVPEHMVFLGTRGALYFFENGEVANVNVTIMSDMTNWKGPFWQYVNIMFLDKSSMVIKSQGYFGGDSGDWKSEIIKGTGRFEGAKGTQNAKAKYLPIEKGDIGPRGYGEGTITYTLPAK